MNNSSELTCPIEFFLKERELSFSIIHDSSPIYALACETRPTDRSHFELVYVCLVDERLEVVFAASIEPTASFRITQRRLRQFLPKNAILAGHCIGEDLRALRMTHPHIIDTSLFGCFGFVDPLLGEEEGKTNISEFLKESFCMFFFLIFIQKCQMVTILLIQS